MKYGCKETVSCSKKCDHEKSCIYATCSCPVSGCSFVIKAVILTSRKFVVLQEKKEGVVFILNNALQIMGNVIMVSCIGPSSKGGYFYELSANSKGNSLIFRSFTPCFRSRVDNPPSVRFLLVQGGFFGSGEKVTLDLCIWRKDACSSHHPKQ
ncbi:hypothetical protein NC651_010799 [Populus alba x Populus x berolinensis]|nr:hypothetical protein NC651_010799 [Populus alba x Populus x berolinensis]